MENSKDAITLSIVFRYLNDDELTCAAKICRLWQKLAKNEEVLRGPSSDEYIKKKEKKNDSWHPIKINMIKKSGARSGLQLFFTDDTKVVNCIEGCHCENLPRNSYSVVLNCNIMDLDDTDTILMSLFFPKTSKTKITTYTFIRDNFKEGLFCPEINFHCGTDIGKVKFLQYHMQPYFGNDHYPSSCMFIFCSQSRTDFLINFLFVLSKWFPQKKNCIWGGILESISVCQNTRKNFFCHFDAHCILIFINNPLIVVYVETLDNNCSNKETIKEKLLNLKSRASLRKYSVAMINTPFRRAPDCYSLERVLFKKIFPDIKLFHMVGIAAFKGEGLQDMKSNIQAHDPENNKVFLETSIMIVTYE